MNDKYQKRNGKYEEQDMDWPEDAQTQWFRGQSPAQCGTYRTIMVSGDGSSSAGWSFWNGRNWSMQSNFFSLAAKYGEVSAFKCTRERKWRGLTQSEYERAILIIKEKKMMNIEKVFGVVL
jgi:hypothetical protein